MNTSLLAYAEQYIERIQPVLAQFAHREGPVKNVVARWQQELETIRAYADHHQHVAVAFVGGTGAGKSTLINALIEADVLPTHSFQTCTSAAMLLRHAGRKSWRATLRFLPETAWLEEKRAFMEEARQSIESGQSAFAYQDFLYKAWALHRPRRGQPPMPFTLSDLMVLLEEPLPDSVRQLLTPEPLELRAKTPEELKEQLRKYLTAESPLWPLVQAVHIEGPIPLLEAGLHLIDLPGLNDANPVRERIARDYLKQAEFICLTFNTGRGLTREVTDLMKDQAFINQIVMDGKVSALAFVTTRADDYQPGLERQYLQLPEAVSPQALNTAREQQIRQIILRQLSELTLWFSNRYKVSSASREVVQLIADTLSQSPIFITSALNYLLLQHKEQPIHPAFLTADTTGVPLLQAYIGKIAQAHGLQARKKVLRARFQQLNSEVKRLVHLLQQQEQPLSALTAHQDYRLAVQRLDVVLARIAEKQGRLQLAFQRKLLHALSDLHAQCEHLSDQWGGLNWQYLAKAVAQEGVYTSPATGVQVNLLQDVFSLAEQAFAVEWYAFFQVQMPEHLQEVERLFKELASDFTLSEPQQEDFLQALQHYETHGNMQLSHLRQQLQREIEAALRQMMLPAFEQASAYKGSGRKQYMIQCLMQALHQDLPELGRALEETAGDRLEQCLQQLSYQTAALSDALKLTARP